MADLWTVIPLLACTFGALLALLHGWGPINRRLPTHIAGWVLALAPLAGFVIYLLLMPRMLEEGVIQYSAPWIPGLGIDFSIYLDGLAALFALLITGIGTMVILYGGYYHKGDQSAWLFQLYMMLFMVSMLGLVVAGDLIVMFCFWEGTSITSFLLIGYLGKQEAARRGALKAMLITGGGGIALLVGIILIAVETGTTDLATVLASGETLRQSVLYPAILAMVAIGALTKSAQTPFHGWLPDSMTAPTPASAFLHSATMVKAGIYLLARLNPALAGEGLDAWFWLLTSVGFATMLVGAYQGIRQHDFKALLAYSTISQLGVLVMLIGQQAEIAFKALVVGILGHALYKSALFLLVGIVDHETGTRDLRRLGGLREQMPRTATLAFIGCLSFAGLPPLMGFLAKETLFETVSHGGLDPVVAVILSAGAIAAGAMIFCQAAILLFETFAGQPADPNHPPHGHEPPVGMHIGPCIPLVLSILLPLVGVGVTERFLAAAASSVAPMEQVKVSLALWHGFNLPLLMSILAVGTGVVLFIQRRPLRALQQRLGVGAWCDGLYEYGLKGIDGASWLACRVQNGKLRMYMIIMFVGMGVLTMWAGRPPAMEELPGLRLDEPFKMLGALAVVLATAAAAATIALKHDLFAILALGASGLAVALAFLMIPAPDVALVMIVVDILMLVILVLALRKFPEAQRRGADVLDYQESTPGQVRDAVVAGVCGLVVTLITLNVLVTRPEVGVDAATAMQETGRFVRDSAIEPFFFHFSESEAGATNLVGGILIVFRALDTLIEVAVFALAGVGVYTLMWYASRQAEDVEPPDPPHMANLRAKVKGIFGVAESPFAHGLAYVILPLSIMLAMTHVLYGHDQPGDGFTAGVIISIGVAFWYLVMGYERARQTLVWLKPVTMVGLGLGLVTVGAIASALLEGSFFAVADFGELLGLPVPAGVKFSTALVMEVSICLAVLGGASLVIDTLGHPKEHDPETDRQFERLVALERRGRVTTPEENVIITDREGGR